MFKKTFAVGTAALALLALSGCGTTEEAAPAASGGDTITVTDARGVEVSITGPVERVVATEWASIEHAMTVGINPVGVSDIEGYTEWAGTGAPLEGDPVDVGDRSTPSIDKIADLAPQVIFVDKAVEDSVIADLQNIAPVVAIAGGDTSKGLDAMYDDVRLVGEATGRLEAANEAIAAFQTHVQQVKERVETAGVAGTPIMQVDGYENGGQITVRTYANGSLLAASAQAIGFQNAVTTEGDPQYGLTSTDVEGLVRTPADAHIVYIAAGDKDVFRNQLATNAIWNGLAPVAAGNVHRLPDGIWLFGGLKSMQAYVDALAGALGA